MSKDYGLWKYGTSLEDFKKKSSEYLRTHGLEDNLFNELDTDDKPSVGDDAFMVCYDGNVVKYFIDKPTANYSNIVASDMIANPRVYWEKGSETVFGHSNRYYITKIELADIITTIESGAFSGCTRLEKIELPDSVNSIGYGTFKGCASLEKIKLPNGVKTIETSMFEDCNSLKEIEFADDITSIGQDAFARCALENIIIPSTVTSIGSGAFASNNFIEIPEFPSGVTKMEYHTFASCNELVDIKIPDAVKTIGKEVFRGCTRLKTVDLNKVETFVGGWSFSGCTSLESVVFGADFKTFGGPDFQDCSSLSKITVKALVPPTVPYGLLTNTFYGCSEDFTIYVPAESLEAYKTAEKWIDCADKIQAIPSEE